MAKQNRKYQNPLNEIKNPQIDDRFEDYGYDVQNAKRYSVRSKRQTKFKDYDDYLDWVSRVYLGANAPFFVCHLQAISSTFKGRWPYDTVTALQVAQRG